jgi:hypothetical protein
VQFLQHHQKNQAAIRGKFKIGVTLAVLLLGPRPVALADDLAGQASVIDGDTLEIHGTLFAYGESMRRKAASFVAARTACSTGAVRRRRTIWTHSSPGDR